MARFCSIDASTNSLAYAIFDNDKLVDYDKLIFVGNDIYEKIKNSLGDSFSVFTDRDIEFAVIEQSIFLNSPKTMSELSMTQGHIMTILASSGIGECYTVPPITWQSAIGNKALTKEEKIKIRKDNPGKSDSWYKTFERNYRKQRTVNFVNINYDIDIEDHDIADAIGIGHYVINNLRKVGLDNGTV